MFCVLNNSVCVLVWLFSDLCQVFISMCEINNMLLLLYYYHRLLEILFSLVYLNLITQNSLLAFRCGKAKHIQPEVSITLNVQDPCMESPAW